MDYNVKEIGRIIAQKRREKDMTLDEVGEKVGVAKSTIQRYEAGLISNPKQAVLESIARTLSLDPAVLTGKKAVAPANSEPVYIGEKKSCHTYFRQSGGRFGCICGQQYFRLHNGGKNTS